VNLMLNYNRGMSKTKEQLISSLIRQVEPLKHDLRFANNLMVKRKDTVSSHSWRACLLAMCVDTTADSNKVIKMLVIHDLTELGKGETQALGFRNEKSKIRDDNDDDLSKLEYVTNEMRDLWREFKEQKTREAIVAKAIERLESNWTAIESRRAIENPAHRQKTIDYITGFLGNDLDLDMIIRQQLDEIRNISGQLDFID